MTQVTWETDHHFNPDHPDFDPDCRCGVPGEERPVPRADDVPDNVVPMRRRSNEATVVKAASARSVAYLEQLMEQARKRLNDPSLIQLVQQVLHSNDQSDVSEMIDDLKKQLAKAGGDYRSNKYAGPCAVCNKTVAANEGALAKSSQGRWIVTHGPSPDDCPAATSDDRSDQGYDRADPHERADTSDLTGRSEQTATIDLSALPSGRYAVPDGDTRLKIKVDNLVLDTPRNSRWVGYVFVKDAAEYGQGQRYGAQRPGELYDGDVQDELTAIMADPVAALARYGQLTGHCGACGRKLEDETSVALGIGPVCRNKF